MEKLASSTYSWPKEYDTMPKLLERNFKRWGDKGVAFRDKDYGIWNEYTWKDVWENVKYFSLGLISLGLKPADRVAIIGDNEPQWYWAAFAIQSAQGMPVPVFTDAISDEIEYIVDHSDSKFIIARDQEQVDKILLIWDKLPKVEKVIWWYWKGMGKYTQPFLISYDQVKELGKKYEESHPGSFEQNVASVKGDDICYQFYTSGTTGLPKAAMIQHQALIGGTYATLTLCPINERDNILCYLPPAWVGEAMFTTVPHLITGATLCTLEEPETIFTDIREVTPALILGGSRQWEGWASRIRARIDEAGSVERLIYNWLMPVALRVGQAKSRGERIGFFTRIAYSIVDWLLLRAIRDRLGLTKARFASTAGSVTGIDTIAFMTGIGIRLRQIYGSTEGGMLSGHHSYDIRPETVGAPLPGVEIRVSDEGEFLIRSPYAFSGFYKDPEKFREAVRGGWWYSGDAGYVDEDGHLVYMDRVSELAATAGGQKYSPQYIESALRFSPYIRDAISIGEGRDYIAVIINIDYENIGRWAERHHVPYTTFTDLSQKPEVGKLVREDIDRVNEKLPEEIRVRKYVNLHKQFDPDEADLTRTRKLKRPAMEKRYANITEAMYGGQSSVPVASEFTYEDGSKGKVSADLVIYQV